MTSKFRYSGKTLVVFIVMIASVCVLSACQTKTIKDDTSSEKTVGDVGEMRNSDGKSSDPTSAKGKPTKRKHVVKVAMEQFYDEWERNKDAARSKYMNKHVEISGKVGEAVPELGFDGKPRAFIMLEPDVPQTSPAGGLPQFNLKLLRCYTTNPKPWEKIGPGGKAILRGTLNHAGYFEGCEIVSVVGKGVPTITAEQLAKAVAADPAKSHKAFHDRLFVVTGVVEKDNLSGVSVDTNIVKTQLKGAEGISVGIHRALTEERQFKGLKPGVQIAVLGKCFIRADKREVAVTMSYRADLTGR